MKNLLVRLAAGSALLVGLLGINPAAAQAPTAPDEKPVVQYIVHPGDTLYRIAVNHGVTVSQIVSANKIRNPNFIYVGQRLVIPDPSPQIILSGPKQGQQVGSPITVTGLGNAFEGLVIVQVRDSRWRVVGSGRGLAAMGEYKPFTITVPYTVTATQVGYIDVFATSGADGRPVDMVTVQVTLKGTETSPACRATYVVKRGDTLARIARSHGITVAALASANRIRNVNFIYVGQRLCIP
jgi:lysozyme